MPEQTKEAPPLIAADLTEAKPPRYMIYYFQERRRAIKTELAVIENFLKEWEPVKVRN